MRRILFAFVVVMVTWSSVQADPFVNEPERNWPDYWTLLDGQVVYNPWVTPFPYQRNIRYTFDNGDNPLQAIYQGYDDDKLKLSDYVEHTSNIQWFPDDVGFQAPGANPRFGLIGIDNRQGTDNVSGWIKFHIDNWDSPNEWKHIWKELIFIKNPDITIAEEYLLLPPGFEMLGERMIFDVDLSDNYTLIDAAYKVWPNPPWEEILITVYVPAGGYVLLDEAHFATECVPEPATVTLALIGGTTLLVLRRRKRR